MPVPPVMEDDPRHGREAYPGSTAPVQVRYPRRAGGEANSNTRHPREGIELRRPHELEAARQALEDCGDGGGFAVRALSRRTSTMPSNDTGRAGRTSFPSSASRTALRATTVVGSSGSRAQTRRAVGLRRAAVGRCEGPDGSARRGRRTAPAPPPWRRRPRCVGVSRMNTGNHGRKSTAAAAFAAMSARRARGRVTSVLQELLSE
jgi:hypothetical protein